MKTLTGESPIPVKLPPQLERMLERGKNDPNGLWGEMAKELHWFENSAHKVILDDERDQVFALTLSFIEKTVGPRASRPPKPAQSSVIVMAPSSHPDSHE